jgi:hypothetical protein
MPDNLARIKAIGFAFAGQWMLAENGIAFELVEDVATARNVLYAFVVDGDLVYVGKTVLALHDRMQRYKTPAKSSAKGGTTNIKNNGNILESLRQRRTVEIFVLADNGLQNLGEFHVNLAAGLEDSLVRQLKPAWNGGKNESTE